MKKKLKPVAQPAVVPIPITLPSDLGNTTLNELLNAEDTEFTKKGNKLSFRRCTNYGTATLEIESFDTGRKMITQSTVPSKRKKADYINDIIEMKKKGMKQKDIAFYLGISESYVTMLLKEAGY